MVLPLSGLGHNCVAIDFNKSKDLHILKSKEPNFSCLLFYLSLVISH